MGFYYLQSRYYDPALGRFLNADSYSSTGQGFLGYNMFAYCNNNPVASADPTGKYIGHRPIMVCDNGTKKIPTKIVSMEQAVRDVTHSAKYSQESWDALDSYGRWNLLSEYTEEIEDAMGLEHIDVSQYTSSENVGGRYYHDIRTLDLSKALLYDRVTALDTVRHELRHYYQHTLCDELYEKNTGVINRIVIEWEWNFQNYIEDGPGYRIQPVEADAYDWEERTR